MKSILCTLFVLKVNKRSFEPACAKSVFDWEDVYRLRTPFLHMRYERVCPRTAHSFRMPRKCCVPACTSNYATGGTIKVYRLPKDPNERLRWISAIPRDNIPDSSNTVVCVKHWPENFPTRSVHGKDRPSDPPSVFPNIPLSQIPTAPPKARLTSRSSLSVRNIQEDQLSDFEQNDHLEFATILQEAQQRLFPRCVVCYTTSSDINIQSCDFIAGIPRFILRITPSLSYEAFHYGVQCSITTLSRNRVTVLSKWSIVSEAIRFLDCLPPTRKKNILKEQIESMRDVKVGNALYSPETILRAFEYFSISRSLYNRFREDYQLPSVRTLTKLTSKAGKVTDLLNKIIPSVEKRQQNCVLLLDEVYVKPLLSYHGGEIFGRSQNKPEMLAKTLLAVMLKCLFGGPTFLIRLIPVCGLDAEFQHEVALDILNSVNSSGGKVIAIICVINACFKSLKPSPTNHG